MTENASVANILIITYNHAAYIEQAVLSVVHQETNFAYTINVLDDCSTDGTTEIVRRLAGQFPDKINLIVNERNIGRTVTQRNFYRGFRSLKGKYIGILEGDDYWSSTKKLQKQVDFLDEHPEYSACAHNVMKVYEDGTREPHVFLPPQDKPDHDIFDLINLRTYFHTTTLLYRNVLGANPPRQFRNRFSCDLFITIAHAQYGPIRFFPDVMSVYRAHPGGRFSNLSETKGWMFNIDGFRRYNRWLNYRYNPAFSAVIARYCDYLLKHGKTEDGLTRFNVAKYKILSRVYKAVCRYSGAGS